MVELTPAAALAAAPRGRRLLLLVGRGLGLLLERADVALLQLAALGAPVVAPLQPLLLLLRRRRRWRRRWLADLFSRVGPHAKRGLEGGEGRQPVLHVAAPVAARGARPALIQVQLPPRALHARVVHLALVLALVVFRRRRAGSAPVALLLVLAHELGRPRGKHAAVVVVVVVVVVVLVLRFIIPSLDLPVLLHSLELLFSIVVSFLQLWTSSFVSSSSSSFPATSSTPPVLRSQRGGEGFMDILVSSWMAASSTKEPL
mmetsp:Transcript_322/g.1198  ORF Transcript_322/g.1198 Transcript_322/m.1198 type:complete len:259 (+) Transcript_322:536-1312(+)